MQDCIRKQHSDPVQRERIHTRDPFICFPRTGLSRGSPQTGVSGQAASGFFFRDADEVFEGDLSSFANFVSPFSLAASVDF